VVEAISRRGRRFGRASSPAAELSAPAFGDRGISVGRPALHL